MPVNQIRFLIVDDIQENMVALEALLRRDGLVIDFAGSATEALELMLVHDYTLAFLDVQMPDTDGYELAELMRGAERTRSVPIIFVTAADRDERRRFRGYEAGAVDYIFKPLDPVVLQSKAEVFFRIGQQARDLERQRDELRVLAHHRDVAISRLKAHADNSPLALIECDRNLTVRSWSKGAERIFGLPAERTLGHSVTSHGWLSAEAIATLQSWVESGALEPRHSAQVTGLRADGQDVHCEVYGSILRDPTDGNLSLSFQILDVTERKRAEEVRNLLVGELNHRIKNTLANVQAIARQTLRQSGSLAAFEQGFVGRLQALARAHSTLSDATWSSASLDQLIDDQIHTGTLDAARLHRHGPAVQLSPENTLRLSLSLHELGTNAAKYGALSVPEGDIRLSWQVRDGQLALSWTERNGPRVAAPQREGFGTALIRASAGGDDGSVRAEWRPEGVCWTITLPVESTSDSTNAEEASRLPANESAANCRGAGQLGGSRVLVIEDEPLVAMDISHELKAAGADSVDIARTIGQAMAAIEGQSIDVALLDGNLSGERVDSIASALSQRSIPFCFVSGYGRQHLPKDFQDAPMIEKPFRAAALLPVLAHLIKG